jgi:hypothetical protein
MRNFLSTVSGFVLLASVLTSAKAQVISAPDRGFTPDNFPSAQAAAESLIPRVTQSLHDASAPGRSMRISLKLSGTPVAPLDRRIIDQLADSIRRELSDAVVNTDNAAVSEDTIPVTVAVHDLRAARVKWTAAAVQSGVVSVTIGSSQGSAFVSAVFNEKPWVADWSSFVNNAFFGRQWVTGQSSKTCTSPQMAEAEARADAVKALLPLVVQRVGSRANAAALAHSIDQALSRPDAISDRFLQRFDRPYGQLWQQSLLIDASPARLDDFARQGNLQVKAEARTRLTAYASLAGFMGVITILYWFLNAATKGYFTGRLRFAAVTLSFLGIVIAMYTLARMGSVGPYVPIGRPFSVQVSR